MTSAAAAALVLVAAPAALADTSLSSNWAGYAVHRPGVKFRKVVGSWRQPLASCTAGSSSYSAIWVGIGGFNWNSPALEQIGTEQDCTPSGHLQSSAWVELVPAAARTIRLQIRPGDQIRASVIVTGHQVKVRLADLTNRQTFARTLPASVTDVSSAEWIVEAPANCLGVNECRTLPLADFGTARFSYAHAVTGAGYGGSISSPRWDRTRINLVPKGRRFVQYHGIGPAAGAAATSALSDAGKAFSVLFTLAQGAPSGPPASAAVAADGRRVRPARRR